MLEGEPMPRNIIIPYDAALKERARELRKKATVSERILWQAIRGKRLGVLACSRQGVSPTGVA
jgi:very-short-patch-repair endonuclease